MASARLPNVVGKTKPDAIATLNASGFMSLTFDGSGDKVVDVKAANGNIPVDMTPTDEEITCTMEAEQSA